MIVEEEETIYRKQLNYPGEQQYNRNRNDNKQIASWERNSRYILPIDVWYTPQYPNMMKLR